MKKSSGAILILWICLLFAGYLKNLSSDTGAPRITREEVKTMLGQSDVVILDVRLDSSFTVPDPLKKPAPGWRGNLFLMGIPESLPLRMDGAVGITLSFQLSPNREFREDESQEEEAG